MRLCTLASAAAAVAAIQILFAAPRARAGDLASIAPSTATAPADKILLSIPDAGGLRITVKPDNKLHIHVAGKDLPADVPSVPIVAFSTDASGYVNGGVATVGADHKLTNLFGTGLDIKVQMGTKLTATTAGITLDRASGSGGVVLLLPLKDSTGKKTEIDIAPLSIGRDGAIHINTRVVRAISFGLPGGISLSAQALTVDYSHKPGGDSDDAKISLETVAVTAPIPGVLTQNPAPLKLQVAAASVNTDGQVSFTGAKLSQTAMARSAPAQVAGARSFAAANAGFPLRIPLMKPADFVIVINSLDDVSLSMTDNVPTALTITCDIELPPSFTATAGGSDHVTAKGVVLSVQAGGGFSASVTEMPVAFFKGFGVHIHNATLDLSDATSPTSAPGGNPWEGLFLQDAEFVLPETIKLGANGSGNIPKLALTDSWIDNNGFTGKVTLSDGTLTVEEFAVKLKILDVQVQRNSIKNCDIAGSLTINSLGGTIDVDAAVADSGMASLHLKTGKITSDKFHADMELQNGTIQRTMDAGGKAKTVLALSGNWRFNDDAPETIRGLAVQVKDLLIGSDGQFALDSLWIDMPESANLDFDVVTLEADRIGFGGIDTDSDGPWVGFTGSVGIGGDLPIQASADFDGLKIYKSGKINVGRIGVDCDIKDIIRINGYIEQSTGEMTRTIITDANGQNPMSNFKEDGSFVHPESKVTNLVVNGKPMTILAGQVAIQLPILGGGDGGPGGAVEFMIARNCWFVMGSFSSTTPLIPLGQSGMAIYGFGGGVGYNITSENPNAVGIPARDYQIVPDIAAIEGRTTTPGGLPNIVALASVRIGSVVSPAPVWGDVTLKVDVGHLTFSLQGNCYLAEVMTPIVPANPGDKNRVLGASLNYDVLNSTFVANGLADICIPKKETKKDANNHDVDNTLLRLHAPFRFKIGAFDPQTDTGFDKDGNSRVFYAKLGGPVDIGQETTRSGVTAHRNVTISDPVTLKIRGLDPIQGALTLDVNRKEFIAALKIHQGFHTDSGGVQKYDVTEFDVHLATIKYKYNIDGEFDTNGWLKGSLDLDNPSVQGEFYVYASLNGKATDLNVDPRWGWSFDIPDIGINAVLEADLYGSLSPDKLYIHGQVYADLGFSIAGHGLSLPFSKDIEWTY